MNATPAILLSLICFSVLGQAPQLAERPRNWHLLDIQEDGVRGAGVEKTYRLLLKDKKPTKKVIVAIIDSGVDTLHPDLKSIVWENKKEIAGNGKDDDRNGYPDDVRGWNFVGNTQAGTFEVVREYIRLRKEFEGERDSTLLTKKKGYAYWKKIKDGKDKFYAEYTEMTTRFSNRIADYREILEYYKNTTGKDTVDYQLLVEYPVPDTATATLRANYQESLELFAQPDLAGVSLNERLSLFENLSSTLGPTLAVADTLIAKNDVTYYSARENITAPEVNSGRNYGNNNILPKDDHGTACAGIVAAGRNNGVGMDGVANHVQIMPVRIFISANEDEIDKDVAHAIEYAVDNGAKVINMSFGKFFSPQKNLVDKAVAYAETKGVLIVSAAGNESTNVDSLHFFPTAHYLSGKRASNLINVGATASDSGLVAYYSNYGKNNVDIFAPGSDIYTTARDTTYLTESGTSFAAPVVSGIAALIWSYYPSLTYKQVKSCIESSATPLAVTVKKPGTEQLVPFSSLSRTGGVVDAFKAVEFAQKIVRKGGTADISNPK
ncbi:hypothetical protein DYBT9623_00781 [Dyadobacter sp. CECT 9623]|uniref:Peptidase S8/S53 domain-containing protein n=1 Tax=Dyadobacter linearis TaxID=2823330 RepID=A0ABM8UKP3_9BACT|nr:S8 family serine peptidase [Dyadobacter sp. CECT 9623]CAG5068053.1 hypothetical protein DYBT9623_00781 [Dyadobacter sp. CECT 9623]